MSRLPVMSAWSPDHALNGSCGGRWQPGRAGWLLDPDQTPASPTRAWEELVRHVLGRRLPSLSVIMPGRSAEVHVARLGGCACCCTGRAANQAAGDDADRAADHAYRRARRGAGSRTAFGPLRFPMTTRCDQTQRSQGSQYWNDTHRFDPSAGGTATADRARTDVQRGKSDSVAASSREE